MYEKARELAKALNGDGCSAVPDFFYRDCCDEHDVAYRTGHDVAGNAITRAEADRHFYECLKAQGRTPILGRVILPWLYWLGVRLFGGSRWQA